jgi:hypothetical protein
MFFQKYFGSQTILQQFNPEIFEKVFKNRLPFESVIKQDPKGLFLGR